MWVSPVALLLRHHYTMAVDGASNEVGHIDINDIWIVGNLALSKIKV